MCFHQPEELVHVIENLIPVGEVIRRIIKSKEISYPFHILDTGDLIQKTGIWKNCFPRVQPFYSVKCNNNLFVLKILAAFGINFSCVSKAEIKQMLNLGVSPSRIIFASPAKIASHIKYAVSNGVNLVTFDSKMELFKLKSIHPLCKLVIQIQCDAKKTLYPLGIKYGCDPRTEAPKLLRLAFDLGLSVIGVSFHIGSDDYKPSAFRRAIFIAVSIFQLARKIGFLNMNLVDIGGGFSANMDTYFNQIVNEVNGGINKWFPLESGYTIIAEPGRFFVATAFTLATKINYIKKLSQDNDHIITYFINDGVYGSFYSILQNYSVDVPKPLNNYGTGQIFQSSIWGPTSNDLDKVIDSVNLPLMEVGNWIIFENMGAYTIPASNGFNEFPLPKIFAYCNWSTWYYLKSLTPVLNHHCKSLTNNSGTAKENNIDKDKNLQGSNDPNPLLMTFILPKV